MRKRTKFTVGAVAAAAIALGTALPASAFYITYGSRTCNNAWTWSVVTATASVRHMHEQGGPWVSATKPAGTSSLKGFYGGGTTWMEITANSGTASAYGLGCSS